MNALEFLNQAGSTMRERGKTYDNSDDMAQAERSMGKTIRAFNAITGNNLTESEGWLLMLILKQVRQWSRPEFHQDSALDAVAYSALLAESLEREGRVRLK